MMSGGFLHIIIPIIVITNNITGKNTILDKNLINENFSISGSKTPYSICISSGCLKPEEDNKKTPKLINEFLIT